MPNRKFVRELGDVVMSDRELANDLRDKLIHAVPFDMTFTTLPGLSGADRKQAEAELAADFRIWAESWIWPIARQLAYRGGVLNEYPQEMPDSNAAKVARGEKW